MHVCEKCLGVGYLPDPIKFEAVLCPDCEGSGYFQDTTPPRDPSPYLYMMDDGDPHFIPMGAY